MGIPVVVIRGILESGKTKFIIDSLINGDFGDLGKTLIFAEEQGEEEYFEEDLKRCKANVVYIENKEDFNDKFINEKVREFKPHVIFIEANEMWDFDSIQNPPYFDVQQVMTIIDGSTFSAYFNNMRQKFNDMIKASDIVIINRCKPTPETSSFKRSVKLINPQVAVLARRLYGKYIAPKCEHLNKRVEEINNGDLKALIEEVMNKPVEELKELYNNREIEK